MEEIWKIYIDKQDTPNGCLWEISNIGRVKRNGILIEPKLGTNGYLRCGGKRIHRMVAETFIPNPKNKPCIDHIDDNKLNNRVDNLRWVTYKENNEKPSHRKKISNSMIKKHLDEDTKTRLKVSIKKMWEEKQHHSSDTITKMSEIRKQWWETHIINEEEHIRRSQSQKGKFVSDETKNKLRESIRGEKHPMFGKHHSEETKDKIRKARLGGSSWNKGLHCSEEQKEKQRKIMTGRKRIYREDGTWYMTKINEIK